MTRKLPIPDKLSVRRPGKSAEDVPALSGKILSAEGSRELAIDGVLRIRGAQSLRIRYICAVQPSRSRATDLLYLNYVGGERSWRKGETVSEYEAVVCVKPLVCRYQRIGKKAQQEAQEADWWRFGSRQTR